MYHGAVNKLLILAVKCRNTRSLKIHCFFTNHKFCWLFLTYHWVIGLLQLFHSHLLQLNSFILHVYLENDNQTYKVVEITHGYIDKETNTLSDSLTVKNLTDLTAKPAQKSQDIQNWIFRASTEKME